MFCWGLVRSALVGVAIAALAMACGTNSAKASSCFATVSGFPKAVEEGKAALLGFQVTNNSQCDFTEITIGMPTFNNVIGDLDDVITGASLAGDTCIAGLKKGGQSCAVVVEFTTGDDNTGDKGDNDHDYGTFQISVVVTPTGANRPSVGVSTITINDTPEPSTLLLLATALGMLGVWKRVASVAPPAL
jgi:hypothetical protein